MLGKQKDNAKSFLVSIHRGRVFSKFARICLVIFLASLQLIFPNTAIASEITTNSLSVPTSFPIESNPQSRRFQAASLASYFDKAMTRLLQNGGDLVSVKGIQNWLAMNLPPDTRNLMESLFEIENIYREKDAVCVPFNSPTGGKYIFAYSVSAERPGTAVSIEKMITRRKTEPALPLALSSSKQNISMDLDADGTGVVEMPNGEKKYLIAGEEQDEETFRASLEGLRKHLAKSSRMAASASEETNIIPDLTLLLMKIRKTFGKDWPWLEQRIRNVLTDTTGLQNADLDRMFTALKTDNYTPEVVSSDPLQLSMSSPAMKMLPVLMDSVTSGLGDNAYPYMEATDVSTIYDFFDRYVCQTSDREILHMHASLLMKKLSCFFGKNAWERDIKDDVENLLKVFCALNRLELDPVLLSEYAEIHENYSAIESETLRLPLSSPLAGMMPGLIEKLRDHLEPLAGTAGYRDAPDVHELFDKYVCARPVVLFSHVFWGNVDGVQSVYRGSMEGILSNVTKWVRFRSFCGEDFQERKDRVLEIPADNPYTVVEKPIEIPYLKNLSSDRDWKWHAKLSLDELKPHLIDVDLAIIDNPAIYLHNYSHVSETVSTYIRQHLPETVAISRIHDLSRYTYRTAFRRNAWESLLARLGSWPKAWARQFFPSYADGYQLINKRDFKLLNPVNSAHAYVPNGVDVAAIKEAKINRDITRQYLEKTFGIPQGENAKLMLLPVRRGVPRKVLEQAIAYVGMLNSFSEDIMHSEERFYLLVTGQLQIQKEHPEIEEYDNVIKELLDLSGLGKYVILASDITGKPFRYDSQTKEKTLSAQWSQLEKYGAGIVDILGAADIMVCSSAEEGAGMMFLEGMAAGIPIISQKFASVDELISNGANIFLFQLHTAPPAFGEDHYLISGEENNWLKRTDLMREILQKEDGMRQLMRFNMRELTDLWNDLRLNREAYEKKWGAHNQAFVQKRRSLKNMVIQSKNMESSLRPRKISLHLAVDNRVFAKGYPLFLKRIYTSMRRTQKLMGMNIVGRELGINMIPDARNREFQRKETMFQDSGESALLERATASVRTRYSISMARELADYFGMSSEDINDSELIRELLKKETSILREREKLLTDRTNYPPWEFDHQAEPSENMYYAEKIRNLIDSIVLHCVPSLNNDRHKVIAVDSSWLPDYAAERNLLNMMIEFAEERGVTVICHKGAGLAEEIKHLVREKDMKDYSDILILGHKDIISSEKFGRFRSTPRHKKATFVGIDTRKLEENSAVSQYYPIAEILSVAIQAAFSTSPFLDTTGMDIRTIAKDVWIFTPKAHPLEINERGKIYSIQENEMESSA